MNYSFINSVYLDSYRVASERNKALENSENSVQAETVPFT